MTTIAPSAALAPFVKSFTLVETDVAVTRQPLPGTSVVLGIRYGGGAVEVDGARTVALPDTAFTGVLDRARHIHTKANSGIVLAVFREGGAARFFSEPLHEIFGTTIGLDRVVPRDELDRVTAQVTEATTAAERALVLERFLLARRRVHGGDALVAAAVRAIGSARGSIRIRALADSLGIGQDRLEKRFRRAVGASPKQLAGILRMRHAVLAHREGQSLTRLSLDAGYADQSHFTREFKAFFGESPSRFFAARTTDDGCFGV